MQTQAKKYIDFARSSEPIDPAAPIRLPGDRMNILKQERQIKGIPLNSFLVKNLLDMAKELNVIPPAEFMKPAA
jgi:LDH2 family malate/lactate/ureidoglycolate dehydrogenase